MVVAHIHWAIFVMPGLGPGINAPPKGYLSHSLTVDKSWVAGPNPATPRLETRLDDNSAMHGPRARRRRPCDGNTHITPTDPPTLASGIHRLEEVGIRLRLPQLVQKELDGIYRPHRVENAAQHVHLLEDVGRNEQLFLAGARPSDVQRRERALIRDLAVEDDFR